MATKLNFEPLIGNLTFSHASAIDKIISKRESMQQAKGSIRGQQNNPKSNKM
jgi:hypothetical protein